MRVYILSALLALSATCGRVAATLTNVHCRIVDYGNNMCMDPNNAYYRGIRATTKITVGSTYVRYRYFSTNDALNPP